MIKAMVNMRCLFLEDNYHFAQMLTEAFEDRGHEVLYTDSVQQSKRLVDEHKFDLLIVDLHLHSSGGETGSGLDLVTYVRHRKRLQTPIVVTTGMEMVASSEVLGYGVNLVFNKPFDIPLNEFMAKVEALVKPAETAGG